MSFFGESDLKSLMIKHSWKVEVINNGTVTQGMPNLLFLRFHQLF